MRQLSNVYFRIYKAGLKLETFYNMLVKDILEEDVGEGGGEDEQQGNGGARDGGRGGVGTGLDDVDFADAAPDLDNCRGSVEVLQTFTGSSSYFHGYLFV